MWTFFSAIFVFLGCGLFEALVDKIWREMQVKNKN